MPPVLHPLHAPIALALLTTLGSAQAQISGATQDRWHWQLTPYVWMTGLHGDIHPGANLPSAHVSQSFSDVLDDLDAAFFLTGTARKDRYVVQADLSYASLSASASLPPGLPAHAKVKQTSLTLTGGYYWTLSPQDGLDAMAGLRAWELRSQLQAPPVLSMRLNHLFADPIVAMRWRHQWTPAWSTLLYADIGGFGVGSHTTWQWLATVNYQWRDALYLSAGYRQLAVDYRTQAQRLNLRMGGPVLGVTWRF